MKCEKCNAELKENTCEYCSQVYWSVRMIKRKEIKYIFSFTDYLLLFTGIAIVIGLVIGTIIEQS